MSSKFSIITRDGEFDFADPTSLNISPVGCAKSLARITRYNGHWDRSWSVLCHSIVVAEMLRAQKHEAFTIFMGLWHDGSECFTGDLPGPLKSMLKSRQRETGNVDIYLQTEAKIQEHVEKSFILSAICGHPPTQEEIAEANAAVHNADKKAGEWEREWPELLPSVKKKDAVKAFLAYHMVLSKMVSDLPTRTATYDSFAHKGFLLDRLVPFERYVQTLR
jgi:hypothetical protein